ncbi:hypothetical protein EPI10_031371 [Gossypium australe]|uniref:Uncharacterized protein n=1 Tax=Gossypium australe TaxID=47621 RepID=A0A5B6X2L8_9ROSI|nr:hypothetical protein EPI10_031371 [Gossypium australe]
MKVRNQDVCLMALEQTSTILEEGHSIMRPLLFNGTNYSYWRTRINLLIQANNNEVRKVITNGSSIPSKRVDNVIVTKEENERDDVHVKMMQPIAKAMHTLFCAIGPNECNRLSLVNESNISFPTLDYELFKISLSKSWEAKVSNIEILKDLDSVSLDELIGSLLTYEMKINHKTEETKEAPKNV